MLIDQIIETLAGHDEHPPGLDSLLDCRINRTRLEFDDMLWRAKILHAPLVDAIVWNYESLDTQSKQRFLLSPEVHRAIYDLAPSIGIRLNAVLSLLLVEHEISAANNIEELSSVDDFFAPETARWALMSRCAIVNTNGKAKIYRAATVDNGLPIDFLSPWATLVDPQSGAMAAAPQFPPDGAVKELKARLSWSFQSLDQLAPTYARIVRNYTRVIRFRLRQEPLIASETVNVELGAVRLLNPHNPGKNLPALRDSLVHESVHHMLTTFEEVDGKFVQRAGDQNVRPVSPWSRNPIEIKSFCHAVFVWYALFNLSRLELARGELDELALQAALARRNDYASGFLSPVDLREYVRENGMLREDVFSAFGRMQKDVREKMS